jgi:hypothetical protein
VISLQGLCIRYEVYKVMVGAVQIYRERREVVSSQRF